MMTFSISNKNLFPFFCNLLNNAAPFNSVMAVCPLKGMIPNMANLMTKHLSIPYNA